MMNEKSQQMSLNGFGNSRSYTNRTTDLFNSGMHWLSVLASKNGSIRFSDWAKLMMDARGQTDERFIQKLYWLWDALGTEPDTQKYLGDRIISLNDEWKNQKPINCATEKSRFGIFFKSFSNYGQPVLSLPNEIVPDAEAIILAPLFLRPGKARRLECCDVSTRLEISLQNPGTIKNESIAFKVDVKELKIEDDCIKVDVKSLNHAYTKASLRLEPHRRSHGGRVYEHIAMKSENDKYVPLETIRKEYEKELKSQLIFS